MLGYEDWVVPFVKWTLHSCFVVTKEEWQEHEVQADF